MLRLDRAGETRSPRCCSAHCEQAIKHQSHPNNFTSSFFHRGHTAVCNRAAVVGSEGAKVEGDFELWQSYYGFRRLECVSEVPGK